MAFSKNTVPASLRKQVESVRQSARSIKPYLVSGLMPGSGATLGGRTDGAALKAKFVRLPQEPEDAKLTGDTRSLDRRLLGLNVGGSLTRRIPGLIA
jgi:hypothetical protein